MQQLHSSVRTGNLETCLRLLSLGAQANFFHPVSSGGGTDRQPGGSWHCHHEADAACARRRRAPRRCTWPPRPGRSCRQSCWWCTALTPVRPTSMGGRPSTTPGERVGVAEGLRWGGGDVASPVGGTPAVPRRQAAQHELAERLVECQYELTDRLAFYLCGRKPGECCACCTVWGG